jgi:hypothetical protein
MLRILLALLFVLALPTGALAETCNCTAPGGFWQDSGGTIAWTGSPCTADATDDFVIGSGCTATVNNLLALSNTTGSVTVNSGGALTVSTTAAGAAGRMLIQPNGITVATGGDLTLEGRFRPAGNITTPTDDLVTAANLTEDYIWRVPEMILCPGNNGTAWLEDCVASQATPGSSCQVMFFWRTDLYRGATGGPDPLIDEAIDAIDDPNAIDLTTNNFVVFKRPGSDFMDMSYDDGQWYEIVDTGLAADADGDGGNWIIINTCQQHPLKKKTYSAGIVPALESYRQIARGVLGARRVGDTVATWTRTNDAQNGIGLDPNSALNGGYMYLNTTTSGANPIFPVPYLLGFNCTAGTCSAIGTAETLRFASLSGLQAAVTASDVAHLARFGMKSGDPFVVVKPAIVVSASTTETSYGKVQTADGLTASGALFDQVASVTSRLSTATTTLNIVAVREAEGNDGGTANSSIELNGTINIDYLNVTGNNSAGSTHGFELADPGAQCAAGACAWTIDIQDLSFRYMSDDAFGEDSAEGDATGVLKRVSCDSGTNEDDSSAQCVALGDAGGVDVDGVVCRGCIDGNDGTVIQTAGGGYSFKDIVSIGSRQPIFGVNASWPLDVVGFVGIGNLQALTVHGEEFRTFYNWVWRHNFSANVSNSDITLDPVEDATKPYHWKNGVIYANDGAGGLPWIDVMDADAPALTSLIENVLVLDNEIVASPQTSLIDCMYNGSDDFIRCGLKRVTIAYSPRWNDLNAPGANSPVQLFDLTNSSADNLRNTVDGLLITGYRGTTAVTDDAAIGLSDGASETDWLNGPCLFDNRKDNDAGGATVFNGDFESEDADSDGNALSATEEPSIVRFRNLNLKNPDRQDFTPIPGGLADTTGCGIRGGRAAPGIHVLTWGLAKVGLGPENAANLSSFFGGGGGGSRTGPRAF